MTAAQHDHLGETNRHAKQSRAGPQVHRRAEQMAEARATARIVRAPATMPTVEEGYSLQHHTEGDSRKLDVPVLRLDLGKEVTQLRQGTTWRRTGHNAKTLVKSSGLRVVLIALKRGASLTQHETLGQLSLQTLEGRVRLRLPSDVVELPVGVLLALGPSVPHDVEAIEPSVVLLTIAWPASSQRRAQGHSRKTGRVSH